MNITVDKTPVQRPSGQYIQQCVICRLKYVEQRIDDRTVLVHGQIEEGITVVGGILVCHWHFDTVVDEILQGHDLKAIFESVLRSKQ